MSFTYNAPSFVEVDNVFPEGPKRTDRNTAAYTLNHKVFGERIKELGGEEILLSLVFVQVALFCLLDKQIHPEKCLVFDHFKGLEVTKQPTP